MVTSQLVIVCTPASDGLLVAPCGTVGGVNYAPSVVSQPVITDAMASTLVAASTSVDPVEVASFWAFPIGAILVVWLLGLGVGSILRSVGDA